MCWNKHCHISSPHLRCGGTYNSQPKTCVWMALSTETDNPTEELFIVQIKITSFYSLLKYIRSLGMDRSVFFVLFLWLTAVLEGSAQTNVNKLVQVKSWSQEEKEFCSQFCRKMTCGDHAWCCTPEKVTKKNNARIKMMNWWMWTFVLYTN